MAVRVGRPEIGPAFTVRFPAEITTYIDVVAEVEGLSRAAWLREAAEERLRYPREALAQLAAWMVDQGIVEQLAYALEKPWKHTDWLYCAEHGLDLETMDRLLAVREGATGSVLPEGWTLDLTTPVDFAILCPHGAVVGDTGAARDRSVVAGCAAGCDHVHRDAVEALLSGDRLPSQHARPGRPGGATVHRLTPRARPGR